MIWQAEINAYELDIIVRRARRDGLKLIVRANVSEDDAQIIVSSPTLYGGEYSLQTERPERLS